MAASDHLGPQFHGSKMTYAVGDKISSPMARGGRPRLPAADAPTRTLGGPRSTSTKRYIQPSEAHSYYTNDPGHASIFSGSFGKIYTVKATGRSTPDTHDNTAFPGQVAHKSRSPLVVTSIWRG